MQRFKKHLDEKLKASDDMGTWVKDFQDSDAPQFKGKSDEKKRKMAIAAKLDAERNEEVELKENPLIGAAVRAAAPVVGRAIAGAAKWAARNPVKATVAGTVASNAGTVSNAVKGASDAVSSISKAAQAAKNVIGGMSTGAKVAAGAAAAGAAGAYAGNKLANKDKKKNEEVELEEKYTASSEKSQFGGHRPHLKNPEGKTSYLSGTAYKTPKHAKGEAQAYHDAYFGGPGKANERGAERAVQAYRAKNKEHIHVKESFELDEETQYDLVESYLLENNIDVDSLTEEELNELIGKVLGGAFKVGAKAAVGAARGVKAVANRASTAGRADAAEKRADAAEKKIKDRARLRAAQQRLRDARNSAASR